jgi:hypothetical protein
MKKGSPDTVIDWNKDSSYPADVKGSGRHAEN